jgi:hypothetical protein
MCRIMKIFFALTNNGSLRTARKETFCYWGAVGFLTSAVPSGLVGFMGSRVLKLKHWAILASAFGRKTPVAQLAFPDGNVVRSVRYWIRVISWVS